MAEEQQDVETLKRRGRRRLVGAVALVLLAIIVLPMVFDPEPRKSAPAVSVRIPGEEESTFTPKVTPRIPDKSEEKKPEQKAVEPKKPVEEQPAAEAKPVEPKKPVEAKAVQAERARAEAALGSAEYIVPVGAFANP